MIKIKYTINGVKFRSSFALEKAHHAHIRIEQLRFNGIEVKVTGMPKTVSMDIALKMAGVK